MPVRRGGESAGTAARQQPLGLRGGGGAVLKISPPPTPLWGEGDDNGRSPAFWGKAATAAMIRGGWAACRCEEGALASSGAGGGWQGGHGPAPRLPPGRLGPAGLPREGEGRRLVEGVVSGWARATFSSGASGPTAKIALWSASSPGASLGLPRLSPSPQACHRTAQTRSASRPNGN